MPTPAVIVYPETGTYTEPASTVTVTEPTTVAVAQTTTASSSGVYTFGGVTTDVTEPTTVTALYAHVETAAAGVASTTILATTYVCPTPGTYTVAPETTTAGESTAWVYPVPTDYPAGTYVRPETTVTVTVASQTVVCPFTAVAPTSHTPVEEPPVPTSSAPVETHPPSEEPTQPEAPVETEPSSEEPRQPEAPVETHPSSEEPTQSEAPAETHPSSSAEHTPAEPAVESPVESHPVDAPAPGSEEPEQTPDPSTPSAVETHPVDAPAPSSSEEPEHTLEKPEHAPQEPEPTPQEPEPTAQEPELTPQEPEPTPQEPEPTPQEPEPTPEEPEPTPQEPDPTSQEPEPTPQEPEPTPQEPEPTPQEPEPTPQEPEPTPQEPEPTPQEPEPTLQEPEHKPEEPTSIAPETHPVASSEAPSSSSSSSSPEAPSSVDGPIGGGSHWCMTYSPYANDGQCKKREAVEADIADIASRGFQSIRLYGTDCDGLPNAGDAAHAHGLKMVVGVFIDGKGVGAAKPQVDDLVDWGRWDMVELVVIGNEALFKGACTAAELAGFIGEAKAKLQAAGYAGPVTTTEATVPLIHDNAAVLCPVLDVLAMNIHPFFNGQVRAADAGPFVASQLDLLGRACPGHKRAYNLESGWPSRGQSNGDAVAGVQEQQDAIKSIEQAAPGRVVFFSYS